MRASEETPSSAAEAAPGSMSGPSRVTSEDVVGAIIDTCDDAILVCDRDGRTTTWSATAERLFGCPASYALGQSLPLLFANHVRRDLDALMARAMAGERILHFETEVLRPDGMPVPVSLSLCPVAGTSGATAGSWWWYRDVTEQRLAQATLAEVEARLEEGEALAHVGSWLWDVRTGAVQWSAEFHRIHGVDPLDFDGTFESHLGLVHPEDREPGCGRRWRRRWRRGGRFEDEYRVCAPADHVRDSGRVVVRAQPTVGSAGTAVGLRDRSGRRARERRQS